MRLRLRSAPAWPTPSRLAAIALALIALAFIVLVVPSHRRSDAAPLATRGPAVSIGRALDASPLVTFDGGLLRIRAHDAPIGEVLDEVVRATGATIRRPATALDRIDVDLGPARLFDVVRSLLDRYRYDYVLVAPETSAVPATLVVLGKRTEAASATAARASQPLPPGKMLQLKDAQDQRWKQMFGACAEQGCDAS